MINIVSFISIKIAKFIKYSNMGSCCCPILTSISSKYWNKPMSNAYNVDNVDNADNGVSSIGSNVYIDNNNNCNNNT